MLMFIWEAASGRLTSLLPESLPELPLLSRVEGFAGDGFFFCKLPNSAYALS
jgi:hypothetical protein